jgi:hypothetical protein
VQLIRSAGTVCEGLKNEHGAPAVVGVLRPRA